MGTSERLGTRLSESGNERASGDETNGEWERASVWGRNLVLMRTSGRLGTRVRCAVLAWGRDKVVITHSGGAVLHVGQ